MIINLSNNKGKKISRYFRNCHRCGDMFVTHFKRSSMCFTCKSKAGKYRHIRELEDLGIELSKEELKYKEILLKKRRRI